MNRARSAAVGAMLAAIALVTSASSRAQDPPIYHFGEIVVTGERSRVVEEVTTCDLLTAEEIARSSARTVDEAIALVPGLHLRRGAEGVSLIDIRGLRTRNVLLLLDGIPLNSSFDGLFDPATLPVEHVAQIKLTRGASSVLYGTAGNAGVLNIVTRAAGAGTDAELRLEAGTSASHRVDGRAALRRGAVGFVTSGSFFRQDAFELSGDFEPTPLEDGGQRLNSDREDRSAFASLTLDPAPGTSLGLNLSYRGGERGKPPITEDFRSSPFAPRPRFERVDADSLSLHAGLSSDLGRRLTLRPKLFFNQTSALTNAFDDDQFSTQDAVGAFREDATASTLGAALQLAMRPESYEGLLTFGLDLRQEQWDAHGFMQENRGGGGGGTGGGGGGGGGGRIATVPIDEDHSVRIASLAAEYELTLGDSWSAVLGTGYAVQSRPGANEDEDGLSFLIGATWAPKSKVTVRGSVARQIRFPTLRDLFAADRGNPTLVAERTSSTELAIEHRASSGRSHLELVLFRSDADNFIQGIPGERLSNTAQVRRQGVEIAGRHRFEKDLRVTWSYTYLDAENRSQSADITTIQNQPRHKIAVRVEHRASFGLRMRGDLLFVADSFALSRTRPTQTLELGDFTVLGLSLSQSLHADRLRLIGRLSNALDESYVESIGFPAPGRAFFVGLEIPLAKGRSSTP